MKGSPGGSSWRRIRTRNEDLDTARVADCKLLVASVVGNGQAPGCATKAAGYITEILHGGSRTIIRVLAVCVGEKGGRRMERMRG